MSAEEAMRRFAATLNRSAEATLGAARAMHQLSYVLAWLMLLQALRLILEQKRVINQ